MSVRCGLYQHFKGKEYCVYSSAKTVDGKEFVLYRQSYDSESFWIRPVDMFCSTVFHEGKDIPRFKLLSKYKASTQMNKLVSILKKNNIVITHSETNEKYYIVSVDIKTLEVLISPFGIYSSYLTDSQLSYRMGYDLYIVNGNITTNKTCFSLSERQKLEITIPDEQASDFLNEKIIKNQMNACSIDLHISKNFYKPKFQTIDMAHTFKHAGNPSKLWGKITLKNINGSKGVVLWPNQTIVTYTYEKIRLPLDCAGKIEIKSTYARLGLSVTASDFCNPGWTGFFPLTIKNQGKHKVVLHPKDAMLQLSLIPTEAPIINEYPKTGLFMDDDGTPFRVWKSKTTMHFDSQLEQEQIFKFHNNVILMIEQTSDDVESEKERFKDTFLPFCQKELKKKKYKNESNIKSKLKLLWKSYKHKERVLKFFFCKPVKFSALVAVLLPVILGIVEELYSNNNLSLRTVIWGIFAVLLLIIIIIAMFIKAPNCYCTFEKLDFDNIYKD